MTAAQTFDLDGIHELFWAARHDPGLAQDFASRGRDLVANFDVDSGLRDAVIGLDVRRLYEAGVNPYLLFFGAIELGLTRDEYYHRVAGGVPGD